MKCQVRKSLGENFVDWPALTLTLSPGERGQQLGVSGFSNPALTNPDAGSRLRWRAFPPLLGERAGVRVSVTTLLLCFAFYS